MNRRIITSEQVKKLAKNKNVARCSSKSVRYSKDFKATAIKQYHEEGLSAVEIFESAGFDLDVIGIRAPHRLMHQWNRALRINTKNSFRHIAEKSGIMVKRIRSGRELRKLKVKVAYLEAENDFLAQLRARKRGYSSDRLRSSK